MKNADTERAINKKANINFRLKKTIEATRQTLREKTDSAPTTPSSKKRELSDNFKPINDGSQCYLNLALFTETDLEKCTEIADSSDADSTEKFISMILSLTNRCNGTNKDLKNQLRLKQQEAQHKERLNQRKESIDLTRE